MAKFGEKMAKWRNFGKRANFGEMVKFWQKRKIKNKK